MATWCPKTNTYIFRLNMCHRNLGYNWTFRISHTISLSISKQIRRSLDHLACLQLQLHALKTLEYLQIIGSGVAILRKANHRKWRCNPGYGRLLWSPALPSEHRGGWGVADQLHWPLHLLGLHSNHIHSIHGLQSHSTHSIRHSHPIHHTHSILHTHSMRQTHSVCHALLIHPANGLCAPTLAIVLLLGAGTGHSHSNCHILRFHSTHPILHTLLRILPQSHISIFSIEPSTLIAGMAPASANVLEDTSSLDLLANAAMPHLLALFDGHSLSTFARREIIIVTADRHVSIFDGRATGHERRIGPQAWAKTNTYKSIQIWLVLQTLRPCTLTHPSLLNGQQMWWCELFWMSPKFATTKDIWPNHCISLWKKQYHWDLGPARWWSKEPWDQVEYSL